MLALGRSPVVLRTLGLLLGANAAYFAYLLWVSVDDYRDWGELLASDALGTAGVYVFIDVTSDVVDWSVSATAVLFMAWLWTMRREVSSRVAIVWSAITGWAIASEVLVELTWRAAEVPNDFQAANRLGAVASTLSLGSALLAAAILWRVAVKGTGPVAEMGLERP